MNTGTVYWITGLSGAGKTTVGKLFFEMLARKKKNVLFLDGDMLREVFGNDLGYGREDRLRCAMRYSRLCRLRRGRMWCYARYPCSMRCGTGTGRISASIRKFT